MTQVCEEKRRQMIAAAAYLRAERRGFTGGDCLTDWLEAEAEVDAKLARHDPLATLEARLSIVNEELQALKKRLSRLKSDARATLGQDLAKLVTLRDGFQRKVEVLRREGEQAGEKAQQQAEKAWVKVSNALERITTRKTERGK
jgi:Protein of unknown function (DUF2934)